MEVTIAMLLTAIVIGITYTVYMLVAKEYNAYTVKHEKISTILLFDRTLRRDVLLSLSICPTDSGIRFVKSKDTVFYEVKLGFIIRNSLKKDTFKMDASVLNLRFEGADISATAGSDTTLIDEIRLNIQLENTPVIYTYRKQYSSENLFKPYTDAIN
ncbi:hypothetical protein [Mucilaginibacter sp. L3T2-6]|uniref:hypothetical protein n=1 Tax=Mucilaginibacter sp. L3T2-6 TaxID=3062491 RepID=UPI0026756732|nr:hypothetical protein [Mucilaginibacter sp. L3T2-6]MDO3645221.1 hypothetical protein [Mucilaginibacter sp. L3T2-6]MDV6217673.1 hypothetical protein [Mucilaginibacter sp. L3T2-6]